ncbi:hypothetical protein [Rhodococcoides yunnanense]|uniref:hypothetical protein n=1 Tax=Rhodococcoides yunnanense TaxID=278209 RepID=UPI00093291CF|nr:hypothetical protein [Rhodococcus yunnanensis]
MNPLHDPATLPAIDTAHSVAAVLLSAFGETDGWETEVFEALCRTPSQTHLHFVLPPATDLLVQLCTSLSGAFGPIVGDVPKYSTKERVVQSLADQLADSRRSWSWSESPSVLTRSRAVKSKRRYLVGASRRPLYAATLRAHGYVSA